MEDRPTAPLVTLHLDRERHLRLTLADLVRYKKAVGKPLFALFNAIGELAATDIPETEIATAIWVMAIHEDPDLTVEQVLEAVEVRNLESIIDALSRVIGGEKKATTAKGVNGQDPLAAPEATLSGLISGASPTTTSDSEPPNSTN